MSCFNKQIEARSGVSLNRSYQNKSETLNQSRKTYTTLTDLFAAGCGENGVSARRIGTFSRSYEYLTEVLRTKLSGHTFLKYYMSMNLRFFFFFFPLFFEVLQYMPEGVDPHSLKCKHGIMY